MGVKSNLLFKNERIMIILHASVLPGSILLKKRKSVKIDFLRHVQLIIQFYPDHDPVTVFYFIFLFFYISKNYGKSKHVVSIKADLRGFYLRKRGDQYPCFIVKFDLKIFDELKNLCFFV